MKKMTVTNEYGVEIDFDVAEQLMDEEICQSLEWNMGVHWNIDSQKFFEMYCRVHKMKYGEEFELNKRNPVY